MDSTDSRVDAYIQKAEPFAQPILAHIRKVVHAACPDVRETMKWSFPHFDYRGMLCSMASFKAHCAFGFWKASLLDGAAMPRRDREAMGQFGRITSIKDLPDTRTLTRLIKAAAALNDAGVKVKRTMRRKAPMKVPAYFMNALRKHKAALATFEQLSSSHKREYVEWVTEAKTEATREKRLATAIEWMAEGKPRNWKYMTRNTSS
jgi:uncharacterized protein YdeI (YjbR/CyaY-like superfamily)